MSEPTKDIGLREPPYPPLVAGGPPYPAYATDDSESKYGLSILDWLAGRIAAGLCANQTVIKAAPGNPPAIIDNELAQAIAKAAYTIAAYMVDVRGQLVIEPTPVPPSKPEHPPHPLHSAGSGPETVATVS